MCFDVCVVTSLSPYCCLSPDCPQGMDESEMGADVILIIIRQVYQHPITHLLCSFPGAKFCVCAYEWPFLFFWLIWTALNF